MLSLPLLFLHTFFSSLLPVHWQSLSVLWTSQLWSWYKLLLCSYVTFHFKVKLKTFSFVSQSSLFSFLVESILVAQVELGLFMVHSVAMYKRTVLFGRVGRLSKKDVVNR
jgi:hypothetical protein